jgi:hypothetical protein
VAGNRESSNPSIGNLASSLSGVTGEVPQRIAELPDVRREAKSVKK